MVSKSECHDAVCPSLAEQGLPSAPGSVPAQRSQHHTGHELLQRCRQGLSQPAPGVRGGSWWSWLALLYGLLSSGLTFSDNLCLRSPALQSGAQNSLYTMAQAAFGIFSSTSFPFALLLLLVALIIFRAVPSTVFGCFFFFTR